MFKWLVIMSYQKCLTVIYWPLDIVGRRCTDAYGELMGAIGAVVYMCMALAYHFYQQTPTVLFLPSIYLFKATFPVISCHVMYRKFARPTRHSLREIITMYYRTVSLITKPYILIHESVGPVHIFFVIAESKHIRRPLESLLTFWSNGLDISIYGLRSLLVPIGTVVKTNLGTRPGNSVDR